MSRIRDTTEIKPLIFHSNASETIRGLSKSVRRDLGESFTKKDHKTPDDETGLARERLKEMLNDE